MTEQLTPEAAMQICRNGGLVKDFVFPDDIWYAPSYNEFVHLRNRQTIKCKTVLEALKFPHPDYPPDIFARDYSPGKCVLPGPEAKALVMSAPPGMLKACINPWNERLAEWWNGIEIESRTTARYGYYHNQDYEVRIRPQWLEQQQQKFNAGNFEPAWKEQEMEDTDDCKHFGNFGDIEIYIRGHEVIFEDYIKNRMEVNAETLRDLLNLHFPAPRFEINDTVTGADALRALADGHWLLRAGCNPVAIVDGEFKQFATDFGLRRWCGPSDDWIASTLTIIEDPRKPDYRVLRLKSGTCRVYRDRVWWVGDQISEATADDITKIAAAMAELNGEK